jgi:hypothetical protein
MLIYKKNSKVYKLKRIWGKDRALVRNHSTESTSFSLTCQEIPRPGWTCGTEMRKYTWAAHTWWPGLHTVLKTRVPTEYTVAGVSPVKGRFSEVAVLNSWSLSESPGMFVKCRPLPLYPNSASPGLGWGCSSVVEWLPAYTRPWVPSLAPQVYLE